MTRPRTPDHAIDNAAAVYRLHALTTDRLTWWGGKLRDSAPLARNPYNRRDADILRMAIARELHRRAGIVSVAL